MDKMRLLTAVVPLALTAPPLQAQNLIINGDFEINTASGCDFNLNNSLFNATVSNATAFGTAEEIDVMKDPAGCGFGSPPQSGDTKLAVHTQSAGGAFDAFSLELSAPVIAGQAYLLQFYAESVLDFDPNIAAVEVGLSNSATSFGTLIFSGTPGTGSWTMFSHTFTAPVGGTHLTVRPQLDAEVWNHIDNFSLEPSAECFAPVTEDINCHPDGETFTYTVEGVNLCTGAPMMFSFTASGGAVGEEMCFTVLINDEQGGLCCTTQLCVTIPDCSQPAQTCDLDGDGVVGTSDLLLLLGAWGSDPGGPPDFDLDGNVGSADLLELLGNWG